MPPDPDRVSAVLRLICERADDPDDFRRLVLSGAGLGDIVVARQDARLERLAELIAQGYSRIRCECVSGAFEVEIARGQVTLRHGTAAPPPGPAAIQPGEADWLLEALDLSRPHGEPPLDMVRKLAQVNHLLELVDAALRSIERDTVHVLDCGCGKSYLSFLLNYYLRERLHRPCRIYGIDTNADLIERVRALQRRVGFDNMEFQVAAVRDFEPPAPIDIVCSLHACDTATDEAIARGIELGARWLLVVPCCHRELLEQMTAGPLDPMLRTGVLKARFADLLTDALRMLMLEAAGYQVSAVEYTSPLDTPKNLLIRAQRLQPRNPRAYAEYRDLCAQFGVQPALGGLLSGWLSDQLGAA
jgi:SAM-dependent methyltransferase